MKIVFEWLCEGKDPNAWVFFKIAASIFGAFAAYFFKYIFYSIGDTKVKFWWKGFGFVLISSIGGLLLINPNTAVNAFASGLIGWTAIANLLKQENKGASAEKYTGDILTQEKLNEMINIGIDEK